MSKKIDEQVRVTLAEDAARGACTYPYTDACRRYLRRRLDSGGLVSPMPHLYAAADFWRGLTPEGRAIAKMRGLVSRHCEWIFCGTSAALLYGLSVSRRLLDTIEVMSPSGTRTYHGGAVRAHHADIDEEPCAFMRGLPVTSVERTLFDCARSLPLRDSVAILDSALRMGIIDKEALIAYVDSKPGRKGSARARFAARFADGRSGSGGESVARAAMWELGFAAPDLQTEFVEPVGGHRYFADFCWRTPEGRVIVGELDGGEKYVDPRMTGGRPVEAVMRQERLRESRLTALVDAVVRFSPAMVADSAGFARLLETFGVPRDRPARISVEEPPRFDEVPLAAYGLD
ncbi:hypothetical protein [Paratractidigestivibacter sp.]|uniref:type IV toxin-antitoxin system AbiEi family antitoxin domain-containing protein n=1 Tax=Paratractidigestivibacter sp. TaxID=2847316 RepID=UPI002ACB0D01|nr:hypothetical protein [Paratractidigestivibacter sp.]